MGCTDERQSLETTSFTTWKLRCASAEQNEMFLGLNLLCYVSLLNLGNCFCEKKWTHIKCNGKYPSVMELSIT